ncbi:MAG: type II toxin-antitoxin system VapC family toxin [Thermomicrobiales bacterium]
MNHSVVVDASVAVKMVINEEFSPNARALRRAASRTERPLIGPPLLHGEVTNTIFQQLRRGEIAEHVAAAALDQFANLGFSIVTVHDLHIRAYAFAREHGLSNIYDSHYVVLARLLGADFWTDDRVLLRSIGNAAPWIRWIGDFLTDSETMP